MDGLSIIKRDTKRPVLTKEDIDVHLIRIAGQFERLRAFAIDLEIDPDEKEVYDETLAAGLDHVNELRQAILESRIDVTG